MKEFFIIIVGIIVFLGFVIWGIDRTNTSLMNRYEENRQDFIVYCAESFDLNKGQCALIFEAVRK